MYDDAKNGLYSYMLPVVIRCMNRYQALNAAGMSLGAQNKYELL